MKKAVVAIVIIAVVGLAIYLLTGFFVIQPIGMLPEGMTLWYLRVGMKLPFITSPDGFLLKEQGSISLLTRAVATGKLLQLVSDRKIARLPYMRNLYLISTGGVALEQ